MLTSIGDSAAIAATSAPRSALSTRIALAPVSPASVAAAASEPA